MSSRVQAIAEAARQFAFQRDQHHGWRRAASWLLLTNALTAAAFAGYVFFHSTVYITVAATPDGRLVPLTPLDEPIMSDAALRNWTVAAVTEAFTLGDVNALAPGLAVRPSGRPPIDPGHGVARLGLGVAVAFHVGEVEAAAWTHPMLMEPCEARPEIGPAASLAAGDQRGALGEFVLAAFAVEHELVQGRLHHRHGRGQFLQVDQPARVRVRGWQESRRRPACAVGAVTPRDAAQIDRVQQQGADIDILAAGLRRDLLGDLTLGAPWGTPDNHRLAGLDQQRQCAGEFARAQRVIGGDGIGIGHWHAPGWHVGWEVAARAAPSDGAPLPRPWLRHRLSPACGPARVRAGFVERGREAVAVPPFRVGGGGTPSCRLRFPSVAAGSPALPKLRRPRACRLGCGQRLRVRVPFDDMSRGARGFCVNGQGKGGGKVNITLYAEPEGSPVFGQFK